MNHDEWLVTAGNGGVVIAAQLMPGVPVGSVEQVIVDTAAGRHRVHSIRLLASNPAKIDGMSAFGITVTGRVRLPVTLTPKACATWSSDGTGSATRSKACKQPMTTSS